MLALGDWFGAVALSLAWTLASMGIMAVVKGDGLAARRRVAAMIGLGWLSALITMPVGRELGSEVLMLLAAGGVAYSLGGFFFALGRPRLWPGVFSYHEFFHPLVILAAVLHFVAIQHYLVPLA